MKIYNKFTLPEGIGNIGFDHDKAYQEGYDAGKEAGYESFTCPPKCWLEDLYGNRLVDGVIELPEDGGKVAFKVVCNYPNIRWSFGNDETTPSWAWNVKGTGTTVVVTDWVYNDDYNNFRWCNLYSSNATVLDGSRVRVTFENLEPECYMDYYEVDERYDVGYIDDGIKFTGDHEGVARLNIEIMSNTGYTIACREVYTGVWDVVGIDSRVGMGGYEWLPCEFPVHLTPRKYEITMYDEDDEEIQKLVVETDYIDYYRTPLTVEMLDSGMFYINFVYSNDPISYSLNGGERVTVSANTRLNLEQGDKLQFFGTIMDGNCPNLGNREGSYDYEDYARFKAYGRVASLLDEYNYLNYNGMSPGYQGCRLLFAVSRLVNARNLILTDYAYNNLCYAQAFGDCPELEKAPKTLPSANHVPGEQAFYHMFADCPVLQKAPYIPYEYASDYAFQEMFLNCRAMNYINCNLLDHSNCTNSWVGGWFGTWGNFIKNPDATWERGTSGCPLDWSISDFDLEAEIGETIFNSSGGQTRITLSSMSSWSIIAPEWITLSRKSGQPGENINITVKIGASDEIRMGNIIIINDNMEVKFEITQAELTTIYVDDFPDGTSEDWGYADRFDPEFVREFYERDTLDEYIDDYLADPVNHGSNKYVIKGTMEYDGEEYYFFRRWNQDNHDWDTESCVAYALMRKSYTKDFLQPKSVAANHDNILGDFCPFDYFIGADLQEYTPSSPQPYILVDLQ